jgi:hypothetical protein
LVTDLEDAPMPPPIGTVSDYPHQPQLAVMRASGQVPALGEVILRKGCNVMAFTLARSPYEGAKIKDQKTGCYVQRPVRQNTTNPGRQTTFPTQVQRPSRLATEKLAQHPTPNLRLDQAVSVFLAKRKIPE